MTTPLQEALKRSERARSGEAHRGFNNYMAQATMEQPDEEPIASRPSLPSGLVPMPVEAFGTSLEKRAIDNLLGLPDSVLALGNFLSQKADAARDTVLGVEPDEFRSFGQPIKDAALEAGVTPENILASVYSGGGLFSSVGEELERINRLEAEYPGASGAGAIGGDVMTLMGGRGRVKARRALDKKSGGLFDKSIDDYINKITPGGEKLEGLSAQARDFLQHDLFKQSMRGAGRSLETGLEAEFLNMLHGGDPGELLGAAMAAQFVSSVSLTTAAGASEIPVKLLGAKDMGKMTKGAIGVGIQSWILGNMLQVLGQTQDQAAETSYDKVLAGFMLAAAFGLPGKRPKDDGVLSNFPVAADAVLTVPRTIGINTLETLMGAPEEVHKVVEAMATDPESFTPEQQGIWSKALSTGEGVVEAGINLFNQRWGDEPLAMETPPEVLVVPKKRRSRGPGFK